MLTVFAHGTLLGPAQVAAHMRSQVSVHELTLAANKHATAAKIQKASATVINAFSKLDVTAMWGDGKTAAAVHRVAPDELRGGRGQIGGYWRRWLETAEAVSPLGDDGELADDLDYD